MRREDRWTQTRSARSAPCRRRRAAISPPSATTRRCAARARSCRCCASARRRPRTRACCCARTSSCCTRPGCFASTSRRPSAAWSSTSWRSSTFRPRSRAAARRRPGTSAISPRHHWMLGYYDPETQHEVWDANPDALIASSIALAAGRGAQGRRRLRRQRPLAVLLRRRQFRLEHARRHGLRRRRQDAGRLAALPGAEDRLRDHRHLVRDGHGRHRQQGHRRQRAVRAGAPRARAAAHAAAATSIRAPR